MASGASPKRHWTDLAGNQACVPWSLHHADSGIAHDLFGNLPLQHPLDEFLLAEEFRERTEFFDEKVG